ncbi:MAG: hypothetical protein QXR54_02070 [Nanopusillaceae archaeon]
MAGFDFKMPNLLEVALLVGYFFTILFGFLLLIKAVEFPLEGLSVVANVLTAIYMWLAVIWIGIVAIILEYTRREIREIVKYLEKERKL